MFAKWKNLLLQGGEVLLVELQEGVLDVEVLAQVEDVEDDEHGEGEQDEPAAEEELDAVVGQRGRLALLGRGSGRRVAVQWEVVVAVNHWHAW